MPSVITTSASTPFTEGSSQATAGSSMNASDASNEANSGILSIQSSPDGVNWTTMCSYVWPGGTDPRTSNPNYPAMVWVPGSQQPSYVRASLQTSQTLSGSPTITVQ